MTSLARYFMPRKTISILRNYSIKANTSLISKNSLQDFENSMSRILDDVISNNDCLRLKEVADYIKKMTEYTIPGGRKTSPLVLLHMYEKCEQPNRITEESIYKSHVLAWCMEIFNTAFLMFDDMIDGDKTRKGKTCWYLLPGVGPRAANDVTILHSLINQILTQNFSNEPYYTEIVQQFNEALLYYHVAAYVDFASDFKTINMKDFNIDRYNFAAECKATHVFKVPLIFAMLLSNKYKQEMSEPLHKVCKDIGRLYQMQNDYLDCYGDVEITGKNGINADILGGKFSWLAVTAVQHCNSEQLAHFIQYYGSANPEHVKRIKRLYDDLQLPELYKKTEKSIVDSIVQGCNNFPKEIPSEPILNIVNYVTEMDYLKFSYK